MPICRIILAMAIVEECCAYTSSVPSRRCGSRVFTAFQGLRLAWRSRYVEQYSYYRRDLPANLLARGGASRVVSILLQDSGHQHQASSQGLSGWPSQSGGRSSRLAVGPTPTLGSWLIQSLNIGWAEASVAPLPAVPLCRASPPSCQSG